MAIIEQDLTDRYALYCGDSCELLPTLPDASVHLSLYSPPFCGLFHYSSSDRDLSNARTYTEFFAHYEFVVRELFRLTKPGRVSAVHCMDTPNDGANTGGGISDFPGDIIRMHVRCRKDGCKADPLDRERGRCGHGWFRHAARYHVWKEPLGVRNRTMAKGLAHRQVVEDSTLCEVANADYLLMFRRAGGNPEPVAHPQGLLHYAGEREMPADVMEYRGWKGPQTENRYSHWIWRQYASAFWDDVRLSRVLPYKDVGDPDDERHVHPLQLDVIERCLTLWSNPGDVVLTPFAGVGSEAFQAVVMGRRAVSCELKHAYFKQSVQNLRWAAREADRLNVSTPDVQAAGPALPPAPKRKPRKGA